MIQINLLPIMEDLHDPTIRRSMQVFFFHHLVVSVSLGLIGTFGYILYAGGKGMSLSDLTESQNIFKSDYGEWLPVKIIAYLLLLITLVLCISFILPVKFMFLDIIKRRRSRRCVWNFLGALNVCMILFGFVGLLESLSSAITLLSAILYPIVSGSLSPQVSFLLPPIMYCKVRKQRMNRKWPGCVGLGVLIGFAVFLIGMGVHFLIT